MASLEYLARNGEKNILKGMFQDSDDESTVSYFSNEDDDKVDLEVDEIKIDLDGIHNSSLKLIEHHSLSNDVIIKLHQDSKQGIAQQLWPAAKFLCDYFETNPQLIINERQPITHIIELGAGIGLCGIFLSKLFPQLNKIIITDLNIAIPFLEENILINSCQNVEAKILSWGNINEFNDIMIELCNENHKSLENHENRENIMTDSSNLSHIRPLIIAADCIYWEQLFYPFFLTIQSFILKGYDIIISHVKRWKKDNKFFQLCKKNNLNVIILYQLIDTIKNENTNQEKRQITRIYRITQS